MSVFLVSLITGCLSDVFCVPRPWPVYYPIHLCFAQVKLQLFYMGLFITDKTFIIDTRHKVQLEWKPLQKVPALNLSPGITIPISTHVPVEQLHYGPVPSWCDDVIGCPWQPAAAVCLPLPFMVVSLHIHSIITQPLSFITPLKTCHLVPPSSDVPSLKAYQIHWWIPQGQYAILIGLHQHLLPARTPSQELSK